MNAPFYIAVSRYPDLGMSATDPGSFDDAVDAYIEHRDDGRPAAVYYCAPEAGTMQDVTADANRCVERRVRQRGYEFPEWLMEVA